MENDAGSKHPTCASPRCRRAAAPGPRLGSRHRSTSWRAGRGSVLCTHTHRPITILSHKHTLLMHCARQRACSVWMHAPDGPARCASQNGGRSCSPPSTAAHHCAPSFAKSTYTHITARTHMAHKETGWRLTVLPRPRRCKGRRRRPPTAPASQGRALVHAKNQLCTVVDRLDFTSGGPCLVYLTTLVASAAAALRSLSPPRRYVRAAAASGRGLHGCDGAADDARPWPCDRCVGRPERHRGIVGAADAGAGAAARPRATRHERAAAAHERHSRQSGSAQEGYAGTVCHVVFPWKKSSTVCKKERSVALIGTVCCMRS